MPYRLTLIGLLSLAATLTALEVGQSAPALDGVAWVKGEATEVKGTITVVEFWATWCGPCRTSIPHLGKLQQHYGEKVRIIGLSTEERTDVEPFVATMGEQMCYHVGIAPETVHAVWMEGRNSIPCAFLIDARGTVVWVGHPMAIEKPLRQVVDGTFDAVAAQRTAALHQQMQGHLAGDEQDRTVLLALVDQLLAIDRLDSKAIQVRLSIAKSLKDDVMLRGTLTALPMKEMPASMANRLAWGLVIDEELSHRNLDLALAFIERALELEPNEGAYLDTMARVLYGLGLIEEAIAYQNKAVTASSDDAGLGKTLAYYQGVLQLRNARTAKASAEKPIP